MWSVLSLWNAMLSPCRIDFMLDPCFTLMPSRIVCARPIWPGRECVHKWTTSCGLMGRGSFSWLRYFVLDYLTSCHAHHYHTLCSSIQRDMYLNHNGPEKDFPFAYTWIIMTLHHHGDLWIYADLLTLAGSAGQPELLQHPFLCGVHHRGYSGPRFDRAL